MTSSPEMTAPVFDKLKADDVWQQLIDSPNGGNLKAPDHYKLLAPLAGNSLYLASLLLRHKDFACALLENADAPAAIDAIYQQVTEPLTKDRPKGESKESLSTALRQAKDKVALLTAFMDVNKRWPLMEVTSHLTDFAGKALDLAIAFAFHQAMKTGDLPWPEGVETALSPALIRDSGYFALAMGKMGGFELNYSSDIDLIIFYDPDKITYHGRRDIKDCMVKITQMVIELMDRRTMYGYVFRTDLRLRPDPGSTPIALSVSAALAYYHAHALNWERSAMIKARPAAGDLKAGSEFLAQLSPWIWRRSMDFEAMGDIIAMKEQINHHYDQKAITLAGYNVKLGHGGIREIEFFTQISQLLLGGRHPEFRLKPTLQALEAMANKGRIKGRDCSDLFKAYEFLRRVEHHIQMLRDEQSHQIPETDSEIDRLICFLGYTDRAVFTQELMDHAGKVAAIYDSLLPKDSSAPQSASSDQALLDLLAAHKYDPIDGAMDIIKNWKSGKYKAIATDRAKRLVTSFLPNLIIEFGKNNNPYGTLARFDGFLRQLPSGVQLFSMLQANPSLFRLLGRIMGLAPGISDILAKHTSLWDAMLEPDFFDPVNDAEQLSKSLKRQLNLAQDYQDILDLVRRWVNEKKFQVAVQTLEGVADIHETGPALTLIADICMAQLLPHVEAEFARKHGRFPDGDGIGMLAMGKYGGKELTFTSDLDVVFLYSVKDRESQSDGPRPLSPSLYFSRLGQQIITAITALTSEGRLFEVDTRLRPSGSQGPLVVTLKTFKDYYSEAAWTWEHMALTRARLIYAPDPMRAPLLDTIHSTLTSKRDDKKLVKAVRKMRGRLFDQFGSDIIWNIKHTKGGLVDLEFIIQYLLLKHGHAHRALFDPVLDQAIRSLESEKLISSDHCRQLIHAHWVQQTLQSVLRISMPRHPKEAADIPEGLKEILCHSLSVKEFTGVEQMLYQAQQQLHSIFLALIGDYGIDEKTEDT